MTADRTETIDGIHLWDALYDRLATAPGKDTPQDGGTALVQIASLRAAITDHLYPVVIAAIERHGREWARVVQQPTAEPDPAGGPCPYTFAHTRHWCGNDTCRGA